MDKGLTRYTDFEHRNAPRTISEGLESEHRDFFMRVSELKSSNRITPYNFVAAATYFIKDGGKWKDLSTLMAEYFYSRADYMKLEERLVAAEAKNAKLMNLINSYVANAIEIIEITKNGTIK